MAMDSVLDERTLREIYLTGFEIAVKEGAARAIMSSYNMVNGVYANENPHLLDEILRREWGFDGYVVTDWGADNDHTEGVRAGCNLVMPAPGPDCAIGLVEAVESGRISEDVLDQRVQELLDVVLSTHEAVEKAPRTFDVQAHHAVARRCAEESIVLLDNDGALPLQEGASVVVIGDFAKTPRYQGAGSSQVNPTQLENLYDCLSPVLKITGYAQGYDRKNPAPRKDLIDEAVAVAKAGETVLLCVGLDEILESEGMDRLHMQLSQAQQELIRAVSAVNQNVILVLSGGAPFVMPERSLYRAAIHGYLGGQAGAPAMADALLGRVNPSGKLNETWPHALEDNPSYPWFPSKERTAEYREGLYVGYRYYEAVGKDVRYPFGYGLSYTTFAYSDLSITRDAVTFTLKNTGSVDGAEVAQVYISCRNGKVFRPPVELKGFRKVFLRAGESATVTIPLDDKAFRFFDVRANAWAVEEADYEVLVAASVRDVKLRGSLHVAGVQAQAEELPSCYYSGQITAVSDAEFSRLLGREIPDGKWSGELTANDAICQLYYARSPLARGIYRLLTWLKKKADAKGTPDLNILFIYNMPFRAISKMSGGMFSQKMVDDVVFLVNGHFFRGVGRLIADWVRNMRASKQFMKSLEGK